jgi:hypothetical protein
VPHSLSHRAPFLTHAGLLPQASPFLLARGHSSQPSL